MIIKLQLKNAAIANKNAAIGYNCIFIVTLPNTAYTVRLQPLAGNQSCVSKNVALDCISRCVLLALKLHFITPIGSGPIAVFCRKRGYRPSLGYVLNAANNTHKFETYSCVLYKTRLQVLFRLRFKRSYSLRTYSYVLL